MTAQPRPKFDREGYYARRNSRILSMVLDNIELKQQIQRAAAADGRSVNGWITHYILPKMEEEMKRQLAKLPVKK